MAPDFIGDAKNDLTMFARIGTLAAKIGKIQLDMRNLRNQRGKHFRSIGVALHKLYKENTVKLDSDQLHERVHKYIEHLQDIEAGIKDYEDEMARLRSEFRQKSGGKEAPEFNDGDKDDESDESPRKQKKRK